MKPNLALCICLLSLCLVAGCAAPTLTPAPTFTTTPAITPAPTFTTAPTPTPGVPQPELDLEATQYGVPLAELPGAPVLYQVNLRAFSPGGDLKGVIARLDEIQALGANVIYLMPIYPPGKLRAFNSPYCVQNYFQVGSEYGTLEDLRTLTDEAHKRNMAVILDWVANHTSWDNPWIKFPDWYTQVNGEITIPEGTGWSDVADLNYNNPDMRAAMIKAIKYWVLEANVDGFRFDAADLMPFDFWQEALAELNALPGRKLILLAEGAREDHFEAGFQLNYAWSFYDKLKAVFDGQPASELYATHLSEVENIPAGKAKLRFTTNHDKSAWEASPVTVFHGKQGAVGASIIATYMGGVPMIYSGQEVGREDTTPFFSRSPINWNANPEMLGAYKDMLAAYAASPALQQGDLQDCSNQDVVCFSRSTVEQEVWVVVNVRDLVLDFPVPQAYANTAWKDVFKGTDVQIGASISLQPYQYLVVER